ncbi:MAG: methyltransferase domain-containing protein [Planctomycetes bacterium]|nr:methyltransferase domain-containing protein [Planctomycetota bacterium]
MAIDVAPLWEFSDPALSERRFRDALENASGDDALILQTQIARTFGLRKQFVPARELLKDLEPKVAAAGFEAKARHALEFGRTLASAAHPPESTTAEEREQARAWYEKALQHATAGGLDGLAIDSIHMLAFVDTAAADQLTWGQKALAIVQASAQPAAKKWEASVRNNVGYALHRVGRLEEAMAQFEQALRIREQGTNEEAIRSARWMVEWTRRAMDRKHHWEQIYRTKDHRQVSWYADHVQTSIERIRDLNLPKGSPLLDVGGGASTLVDDLVGMGFTNVTVMDLSSAALEIAQSRMGSRATAVHWIEGDLLAHDFGGSRFSLWHDRAVFHFLADEADRTSYRDRAVQALAAGGFLVLSVFADDGPLKCSGLEIKRHGEREIEDFFAEHFKPVAARRSVHLAPGGAEQRFVHLVLQRK